MSPRPTAIFAGNDEMAAGIYQAARDAGLRIPEDLSVVGYDDSPIAARLWPQLTSVRLPIRDMGRLAAEKLIAAGADKRMQNGALTEVIPTLVIRHSTAKPPSE